MEKKELKFYAAPACEVVELKVRAQLMAGSPTAGGSENIDPDKIEPGFFD